MVQAIGGGGHWPGGLGRLRIERVTSDSDLQLNPDPSVVGLADDATALIWPPEAAPTVKIVSLGATDDSAVSSVPEDPRADFGGAGSDVVLPQMSTVKVVVETTNVEPASTVLVRRTLRTNGNYHQAAAVLEDPAATEDPLRWVAELPVPAGFAAFQVRVVRP